MDEEGTIEHGHDAKVQGQAAQDEEGPGEPELLKQEVDKGRKDEGARPYPGCGQPHPKPAATVEVHAHDDDAWRVGQSSSKP